MFGNYITYFVWQQSKPRKKSILIFEVSNLLTLTCIPAENEDEGIALNGIVPLQDLSQNTFFGHMEAEEGLHQKLLELRDRNGGQLAIIYYVG